MLTRYTYPVTTSLFLTEQWPVAIGDIQIEWHVEGGNVTAVSTIVPVSEIDQLPTVQPSDTPGVKLDINLGWSSREEEAEGIVRTIRNLLSLFASVEIDLDHVEVTWEPENEDERQRLQLYSFSLRTEKLDLNQPRHLGYELVARSMASAEAAAHFEIPLGFLRRGNREIHSGRYVDAIYNLFFFLETLFAPGYSNPEIVKQRLQTASPVREAVTYARSQVSGTNRGTAKKWSKLLDMTDEELIGHLVKLRGSLHHHALHRPGVWHPDKPNEFLEEANLLQEIVHKIAMNEVMPILFSPERDEDLMVSADNAGAVTTVRIEPVGLVDGVRTVLSPLTFRVVGRRVSIGVEL